MIKKSDYFRKFEGMKPDGEAELPLDGREKRKVLWIDDNLAENTAYRKSVNRAMPILTVIPEDVELLMLTHDEAMDEILDSDYSLLIIDDDVGRGERTLREIKRSLKPVPVVFVTMPGELTDYVKNNVSGTVNHIDMPRRLGELIQTYSK